MKLLLKIIITVFVLFILVSVGGAFYLTRGLEAGAALAINAADISTLRDGEYEGEYKSGRFSNKVKVTIKDHKISEVLVTDDMVLTKSEVTAELIDKVLKEQTTKVDAISGSTVTCKAYLSAIENALEK